MDVPRTVVCTLARHYVQRVQPQSAAKETSIAKEPDFGQSTGSVVCYRPCPLIYCDMFRKACFKSGFHAAVYVEIPW
jgi:hypothetical protein